LKYKVVILFLYAFSVALRVDAKLPDVCTNDVVRYTIDHSVLDPYFNWVLKGGKIIRSSASQDTIDVLWNVRPGMYSIGVSEVAPSYFGLNGCVGDTMYSYVEIKGAAVFLDDQEICQGQSAVFDAGDAKAYLWQNGTTNRQMELTYADTVWVKVTNKSNCSAIDSAVLTVYSNPEIEIPRDTFVCEGEPILLDVGGDWRYVSWSTGENTNSITINEPTEVAVTVTDMHDCKVTDSIRVLECVVYDIKPPTAFTPNNDGYNDTWVIPHINKDATVEIYDRWGRLVFESDAGYTKAWDGRSNGKSLPMDTYFYVINFHNGKNQKSGTVTILK
jgi:gliding motility-associated-like protein